jgi:fatty-acyl-CoA synthase
MTLTDNIVARLMICGSQDRSKPILTLMGSEGGEQHYTYPELFARSLAWAGVYCENGLRQGSHVVVILPHSLDLYASYTGALLVGMIPAMFSFPSPKLSLQEYVKTFSLLLENAHPQMVVTSPQLKEMVRQNLKDCLKTTRICDPSQAEYSKVRETSKKIVYPDPDAIAFLQYSSGTTGIRKGVAITHRALLRQIDTYAQTIGLNSRDSIVSWLPLYHDMGLICCYFLPLMTSTPIVALSPFDWVRKPVRLFETVTKHRSTLCWLPNFAYHFMANSIRPSDLDSIDLSSLRGIVNCSEPVLTDSHRKFLDRFMGCGLRPEALAASYAMAETTFAVTSGGFNNPLKYDCIDGERLAKEAVAIPVSSDHPKAKWMASSGMALPGTSIEIQSDTGQGLPDRRVGHIAISSPSLFQGYYRNPAATAASYKAGVLHTGDMGYQTDGHLFVIGRFDDVIIIAGKNIYPQDIEQIVNDIPGVIPGRCVALGIPDIEKGTERLVVIAESEGVNPPHQPDSQRDISADFPSNGMCGRRYSNRRTSLAFENLLRKDRPPGQRREISSAG